MNVCCEDLCWPPHTWQGSRCTAVWKWVWSAVEPSLTSFMSHAKWQLRHLTEGATGLFLTPYVCVCACVNGANFHSYNSTVSSFPWGHPVSDGALSHKHTSQCCLHPMEFWGKRGRLVSKHSRQTSLRREEDRERRVAGSWGGEWIRMGVWQSCSFL